MARRLTISVIVLIALVGCSDPVTHASTGSNPHVGFCSGEPSVDLPDCECPEAVDCSFSTFDELPRVSDLERIQQLAGITTEWNADDQVWDVRINTLAMPGQGVVVVDEQSGQYDGVPDFFAAMSRLLGQEVEPEIGDDGAIRLPPIRLVQSGISTRLKYDGGDTATWVEHCSASLLWNALTDAEGRVWIGGQVAMRFPPAEASCPGADDASFASAERDELSVEQCTDWDDSTGFFLPLEACEDMGFFGDPCFIPTFTARTTLRLGYSGSFSTGVDVPVFRCETLDTRPPFNCSVGSSHYIRLRQQANMQLEFQFFDNDREPRYARTQETPVLEEASVILVESTLAFGMCSRGTVERDGTTVELATRDGLYDRDHPACRDR